MEKFSQQLKKAREAKGFTQTQTAQLLGIPRSTYRHYENGGEPTYYMLCKIASLFNCTVNYLFGRNK